MGSWGRRRQNRGEAAGAAAAPGAPERGAPPAPCSGRSWRPTTRCRLRGGDRHSGDKVSAAAALRRPPVPPAAATAGTHPAARRDRQHREVSLSRPAGGGGPARRRQSGGTARLASPALPALARDAGVINGQHHPAGRGGSSGGGGLAHGFGLSNDLDCGRRSGGCGANWEAIRGDAGHGRTAAAAAAAGTCRS